MDINYISVILILFALLSTAAILIYFLKSDRRKGKEIHTEAFLQSVLQSVDNIVNYYEPVYDGSGEIIDFRIVYANECNREYLGLAPEEIIGRPISEVFPFLFLNGEFEGLVECFVKEKKVILHRQITVNGERMWFKSIIKPLPKGICVTARNTTPEKSTEESLRSMNKKLEERNRELSDTVSFLDNVMRSTPGVVAYLEPILDRGGSLADFEIIFASEAIEDLARGAKGEIEGRNLSDAYPDFMQNGVFDILSACVRTGTDKGGEIDILAGEKGMSTFDVQVAGTGSGVTLTLSYVKT